MRDNALPLSGEQLTLVRQAADGVPPAWRSRYLDAVVDLLMGRPRITNAELLALLGTVRRTMILGRDAPALADDPHR